MAWIIIEYDKDPETTSIIVDEKGFSKLFCTEEEATEWAKKELSDDFKVVEIERKVDYGVF